MSDGTLFGYPMKESEDLAEKAGDFVFGSPEELVRPVSDDRRCRAKTVGLRCWKVDEHAGPHLAVMPTLDEESDDG